MFGNLKFFRFLLCYDLMKKVQSPFCALFTPLISFVTFSESLCEKDLQLI